MSLKDAKREYVNNVFKYPEPTFKEKVNYYYTETREFLSEWVSHLSTREYQFCDSIYGFGLKLHGVVQLELIVNRYRRKLCFLRLLQHMAGGVRPGEILDFKLLTPLLNLKDLSVSLDSCNASAIESFKNLRSLCLDWDLDEDVDLTTLPYLEALFCPDTARLQSLWRCQSLKRLWIDASVNKDLTHAMELPNLESFEIGQSRRFVSLAGIDNLPSLRFLGLYHLANLTDLNGIGGAKNLEYIVVEGCSKLSNIDAIHDLPNLKYLEIRGCRALKSMAPFGANPSTTHVFFMEDNRLDQPVEDIVKNLPNLQYYFG